MPTIVQGATIHDAYLDVHVDSVDEDMPTLTIWTEASVNPASFTNQPRDISSRTKGAASVAWTGVDIGDGVRRSPRITSLIAERVADPQWVAGSPIVVVLDGLDGWFEIRQFDHTGGTFAAQLTIVYENP